MFVGRKKELTLLDSMYLTEKFEMLVLYGRRRVGKTRLLTKFIENKSEYIFFQDRKTMTT